MKSKFKILQTVALQLSSSARYQENMESLLLFLQRYQDRDIIVVPEVYLTSFDYDHMPTAAKFSATALKILKREIDKQIVFLTLILKEEDGFVNQAVVIHRHRVIYRQNKARLFRLGGEDLYFQAGKKKKIKPFEINGIKYAILICFELRFKDLWKQIEGADIVIVPARWGKVRKKHLEILSRALAVMNQCYVVVANSANSDMASSSSIISPTGTTISNDNFDAIEGDIDFREIKKMRRYIVME